ncbi:hypothetical protein M2140_000061 [Clostridiales Family XIII bacterium PM5-7]
MLNIEKYKEEIREIGIDDIAVDEKTGAVVGCGTIDCCECAFGLDEIDIDMCNEDTLDWLTSEYVEKPKLTKRERAFCEFAETGWIMRRDSLDHPWFFPKHKPHRDEYNNWRYSLNGASCLNDIIDTTDKLFPFIIWKDEEPWSVEELLKLEIE